MILQEPERRARLNAFLRELIERPVPAVTALLVMRSDYLGALDQLDLPVLRQRDNWREVGAFTQSAAAAFLDRSGLQLGPELRVEILREAGEVEENPGLIRPITLNMFGLVLGRFEGTLPKGFAAGRLLTGYLQDALKDAGEHAVPIVRRMVSDVATKQPRSEADLAKATGLSPHLVRGCLLALGSRGLVRPIDQTSRVWEIAHDFVARLLAQVVSRWRAPWWRMARPWIAPSSLALWLAVVFAALPAYRTYVAENPFRALRAMDIQVTGADDSYRVEFPALSNEAADALLRGAATHLKELGAFHLDLSVAQVHKDLLSLPLEGITELVPLTQLTNMRVLDLSGNPVVDLAPLADLPALHTLNLSGTLVSDLAPLSNLTGLKKLDLSATWVTDLAPVGNLTALQSLALMTEISDLTPLADLTSLRELHLFKTQGDLAPLGNLTSLETLSLLGARISDLSALANLPALDTLSLMYSEIADLTPLVDLAALQSLDLSAAKVAEEDVEALRRAFIQRGQEVKISSGNLRQPGDGPYPFPAGVRGGSERGGGLAD